MALSSKSSTEYLDIKVFLYKYTPPFTFLEENISQSAEVSTFLEDLAASDFNIPKPSNLVTTDKVEGPGQITKYGVDLTAPTHLSKYDITQFAKGYSFKQSLYGGAYDWNINFQDAVIPFSQLSIRSNIPTIRKGMLFKDSAGNRVAFAGGPQCRSDNSGTDAGNDLVHLMAQYEAESSWPQAVKSETSIIEQAFLSRGTVTTPFASNSQGNSSSILNAPGSDIKFNNPQLDGIRLSDLTQKYNYISVFVYKSSVSPASARKASFPRGIPNGHGGFDVFDPSNEVHLMLTGYTNEFNGFVTGKNLTRSAGAVDTFVVTGHGGLRLFSDTRTLFDPSIIAGGLYGASILNSITAGSDYISVFQNLFQGKDPVEILTSLLFLVYRISFNKRTSSSVFAVPTTAPTTNTPLITPALTEYQGFYDIHKLAVSQFGDASTLFALSDSGQSSPIGNLFTIPPLLQALVMSLRNYDYNLLTELRPETVLTTPIGATGPTGIGAPGQDVVPPASLAIVTGTPDKKFQPVDPKNLASTNFAEEFGGPCVQISAVDILFPPYFKLLKNGFGNFNSNLKTPHDIMDEVTHMSFLEFYERPNGRIILRTPQYNQLTRTTQQGLIDPIGNLLTSNDVLMIDASYSEDGTQLQTQKRGSYSADLNMNVGSGLVQPSYGNGKLMVQYGFREATAEANPAVAALAQQRTAGALAIGAEKADINNLVHKYLRFLLEFDNAGRRTGSINCDGNPALEVGKLFFDSTNSKIGYIVDVTKNLIVGQTYRASINLKFVRDVDSSGTNFRQIPTLEELMTASENAMIVGAPSTPIIEFPSVPAPKVTAASPSQALSNLGQTFGIGS